MTAQAEGRAAIHQRTLRQDRWWLYPLVNVLGLGLFANSNYWAKPYISPFYSPCFTNNCAHRGYSGGRRFPLILQNSHRYWFYTTVVVAGFLTYDAAAAFVCPSGPGVPFGSIVLLINAILIWGDLGGCHSCRHVLAGRLNHFSRHSLRYRLWTLAGRLNGNHQEGACASMIWIALADVYIRLVAAGVFADPHWIP